MDRFVASAPRNDGANIIILAAHLAPELCKFASPFSNRGRGECRVPNAPAASCALGVVSMHTSIHSGGTGNIRHSPRNGLTAYGVLSPETNSSCLRRRRIDDMSETRLGRHVYRRLDTSNGCQDHTLLPYASAPLVLSRPDRSRGHRPAIRPRARRRLRPPHPAPRS